MKQFYVLYQKELLEMWRNYKIIWVPIVFIILGLSQPITAYYQPEILEMAGLTKEAIAMLPQPDEVQVLIETLSQFNLIGALVLVLAGMSIISGERQSGVAAMIFVKPVSYFYYILGKWFGYLTITVISVVLGYLASCYYTNLLIGSISYHLALQALPLYLLWFTFIITITIFNGTMLDSSGAIAFLSLFIVSVLSIITSTLSKYMEWSPAKLSSYSAEMITDGKTNELITTPIIFTILVIAFCIFLATVIYKQKQLIK